MDMEKFIITEAGEKHLGYVQDIEKAIQDAAKVKGTGLAKRSAEYLTTKILEGKAIIAHTEHGDFAGFCYIESWGHEKFVANSGLIVLEKYRGHGLAMKIKARTPQAIAMCSQFIQSNQLLYKELQYSSYHSIYEHKLFTLFRQRPEKGHFSICTRFIFSRY